MAPIVPWGDSPHFPKGIHVKIKPDPIDPSLPWPNFTALWAYVESVPGVDFHTFDKWCLDNIGPMWEGMGYPGSWYRGFASPFIYFEHESDAALFMLAWRTA